MADCEASPVPSIESGPPDWGRIEVDVLCPLCGYNLRGLTESRCPECGYRFTWPEVLDPRRGLHPHLFEHHPERNFWSFLRTAVGVLLPFHFWKSVHPTQPSNRRRLITYCLIGQGLYVFALLTFVFCNACITAQANKAAATMMNAQLIARFNSLPVKNQQQIIKSYGSLHGWVSSCSLSTPSYTSATIGCLKQQLTNRFALSRFTAGVVLPLLWPWLTYLSLRLFAISMQRARVNKTHVLRCSLYSFDQSLWAAVFVFAMTPVELLTKKPREVENQVLLGLLAIWLVSGFYGLLRLYVAYKHYLRFDHPFLTALSSQLIVTLVAVNAIVFVLGL